MSNEPNRFPFTAYFPDLTQQQLQQLDALYELYTDWNAKINVISRKDIENLYPHHVLHSLGIVKMLRFKEGSTVMDLGTGGGFPGIPLAILFPQVHFHLVDSIGKKIKVAQSVADSIGLQNVSFLHGRGEEEKGKFDFVVSRAVMPASSSRNTSHIAHGAVPAPPGAAASYSTASATPAATPTARLRRTVRTCFQRFCMIQRSLARFSNIVPPGKKNVIDKRAYLWFNYAVSCLVSVNTRFRKG